MVFTDLADDVFGPEIVREARAHPALVHFEGPDVAKPWHYLCTHPRRRDYLQHRRATPWRNEIIDGRTGANVVLRRLPGALRRRALLARARKAASHR